MKSIEIIVVDDGSTIPASDLVNTFEVVPPFELRSVRQANAGPASARNSGFRLSHGDIVLFVDDDIISGPDLLQKHIAAHRKRPSSVIFGRYPFLPPTPETPLYKYLISLGNDPGENAQDEFIEWPLVASGHISVERQMFADRGMVYAENLATPAAEEFELSHRLQEEGIPLLLATQIVAAHNRPLDLEAVCRQQYTYGLGCAEVSQKCPETRKFSQLRGMVYPCRERRFLRNMLHMTFLRNALSAHVTPRRFLLRAVQLLEAWTPIPRILPLFYRVTIGLHFSSGIRRGLKLFSGNSASTAAMREKKRDLSEHGAQPMSSSK